MDHLTYTKVARVDQNISNSESELYQKQLALEFLSLECLALLFLRRSP